MPLKASSGDSAGSPEATITVPGWLWGGEPDEFARVCRWTIVRRSDDGTAWTVRLQERSSRGASRLVRFADLADAGSAKFGVFLHALRGLERQDHLAGPDLWATVQQFMADADERYPGDVGAWLGGAQSYVSAAPDELLPEVVRAVLTDRIVPNHCPAASVGVVTVDRALPMRFAACRVLIQMAEDPALLRRPAEGTVFNAARALHEETTFGLGAYLAPLLGSLSPWVWAVAAPRAGCVFIFSLGQAVSGRRGLPSEPLQMLQPASKRFAPPPRPMVSASELRQATRWWIRALSELFSEVTDPANYRDGANFVPRRNLERLLTLQQCFSHVQGLAAHERDSHVRRVLMFNGLDSIEGLGIGLTRESMTSLKTARSTLARLEESLPAAVSSVLLPRARSAVAALEELQQGFFLATRVTPEGIRLPDKNRGEVVVPLAKAAQLWLGVMRNAQHGFGGRKDVDRPRDEALLSSHDGDIPYALADLPWLYLLRLLDRPTALRRR